MSSLLLTWPPTSNGREVDADILLESSGLPKLVCRGYAVIQGREITQVSFALAGKRVKSTARWIDAFSVVGHTHNLTVTGRDMRIFVYRPLCTVGTSSNFAVCYLNKPPKVARKN